MEIFHYYPAKGKSIGLLSIPHSGTHIPNDMSHFLIEDQKELNRDVDQHVHKLVDIQNLQESGIHILVSTIHRAAVDLNRSPEICVLNWKENTQGVPLVTNDPSTEQIKLFQNKYHRPYFEMVTHLKQQLEANTLPFKAIDLHSMPSKATAYHLKQNPNQIGERPSFCLSDFKGQSCHPAFIQMAKELFEQDYQNVKINDPYFGGYLTQFMSGFKGNNIQIEINRKLYMNEESYEMLPEANDLKVSLTSIIYKIFNFHSSALP